MNENNKKRTNSFRKLFPNLFFSNKSKQKLIYKDVPNIKPNSLVSNQYQSPQSVISRSRKESSENSNENIYENLTVSQRAHLEYETRNHEVPSNHSSSSTLVSESVKNKSYCSNEEFVTNKIDKFKIYAARPQVPRKPQNDNLNSPTSTKALYDVGSSQYPDVYYHSLEKLVDKISPIEEIDIYRASKSQVEPAPVGAEIKKVSTRFLISPKKEAEVRTIQPNRARSLSLEKNGERSKKRTNNENNNDLIIRKPYNYSAPTSPMPINHKIPNMPKTVSPYEHVRKTMIEAEEKRNTLNRTANKNNNMSLNQSVDYNDINKISSTSSCSESTNSNSLTADKEKTRQKVEAFYWQKLKEQKQKEDELLFQQSHVSYGRAYSTNSSCSTPSSYVIEPRSYSLPRGTDLCNYNQVTYATSPFIRGAPERRTDSFVPSRGSYVDQEIIYRHPEKNKITNNITPMVVQDNKQLPIIQRGSLTEQTKNSNQLPKRVSFEGNHSNKSDLVTDNNQINIPPLPLQPYGWKEITSKGFKLGRNAKISNKGPPRPPLRTTSVTNKGLDNKIKQTIYSESESGSEAGEIQRILQGNHRNEEDWHGDGARMDGGYSDGEANRSSARARTSRRDDPRRHTLAGNDVYIHPHQIDDLELEPPLPRNYPSQNALLFDDDPGIMSEVETASTGFRRGGKQRSSLPVVRTPSKTLERPLGEFQRRPASLH